ncbi:MAG TPA: DEAD/DEAH box helicase family protein [Candidatus Dormibacteraeota bacterium]|nr:DEAD/DEAH box helicase family protein [Candidatus Dormibacteraeota bacterium]
MSSAIPLVNSDTIEAIAARLELRAPNRGALDSIAKAVAQHYEVDGGEAPFECVVDLATAVGKTYVMAAAIDYFAAEGVRNFAVITPGRTILRKTVDNFTPGHPKSLLRGIEVQPVVITSENFATPVMRAAMEDDSEVKLFVFTVQALLKPDTETGRKTRKFQEGLGKAFYDHLQEQEDLVVFADEHHCYYGKAFSAAIRELVPRVLVGLTATPDKKTPPEQVIYRYPLARAIADQLVKTPVLVGRKDDLSDAKTKLRDGVRLLEAKAKAVETYCSASGMAPVRPMMLVVAPTIEDANKVEEILTDPGFADGAYADSILNINSSSPEEALEGLDEVETPSSKVRIIVSVGMLKEGWDVKSVYVIASLRPSISDILTEQTLGRGMRLPFGAYTGIEMLDTLEVLAHERYQELLKKANVINEAFIDYRVWMSTTRRADGREVAVIERSETATPVAGEDGSEPGGPEPGAAVATVTSVETRVEHVEAEVAQLSALMLPREDVTLRIPKLVMQGVQSKFTLSDITDRDPFKRLGERLAADADGELRRVKVSARTVTGRDGLTTTHLVTSDAVDKVSSQVPLLPLEEARSRLADLVLGSDVVPARAIERARLAPIMDALVAGLGDKAVPVLSTNLDRVAARVIDLISRGHKEFAPKPSYEDVVEVVDFGNARLQRPTASGDRFGKFERQAGYEGWAKGMYPQAWFDSGTELEAANIMDAAPEVAFWVRLERNDCPILWTGMKTLYNPDFIVVETGGAHYVVEIKMEKEGSTPSVLGKAEAALRWVNHVNADPKTGATWTYLLVLESDVEAAKGSWSALKALNRT